VFNPYFRITLEDCFKHPFFQKVRKAEKESVVGQPVSLDFEKSDLNRDALRALFLEEAQFYKSKKQQK
jgi:hypothetical protein